MTRQRQLLEQLIKQWAQDHTADYIIANYSNNPEAMKETQNNLNWVLKEGHCMIDLFSLVERMDLFVEKCKKKPSPDGMNCCKCKNFFQFAEPNQDDGSLICFSCKANPYV